jgi:hypothetical protein
MVMLLESWVLDAEGLGVGRVMLEDREVDEVIGGFGDCDVVVRA